MFFIDTPPLHFRKLKLKLPRLVFVSSSHSFQQLFLISKVPFQYLLIVLSSLILLSEGLSPGSFSSRTSKGTKCCEGLLRATTTFEI